MRDLKIILGVIFLCILFYKKRSTSNVSPVELKKEVAIVVKKIKDNKNNKVNAPVITSEIDTLNDVIYKINYLMIQNECDNVVPVDNSLYSLIQKFKNQRQHITYTKGEQLNAHRFIEHFGPYRKNGILTKQSFVIQLLGARHSGEVKILVDNFIKNQNNKLELEKIIETFKVGSLEHIYTNRDKKLKQIKNLTFKIQQLAQTLPVNADNLDSLKNKDLKIFIKRLTQRVKLNEMEVNLYDKQIGSREHFKTQRKTNASNLIKTYNEIIKNKINKLKRFI